MLFRDANKDDLAFIAEVYNEAIESRISTADTVPVGPDHFSPQLEKANPKRPLWIVEINNVKIGWVSFRDFYGRPAYSVTAELSIYLARKFQQKGLGTGILETVINRSAQMGIQTLVGFIFSHNHASLRLVNKAGFEQWGLLPEVAEIDGALISLSILGKKTG